MKRTYTSSAPRAPLPRALYVSLVGTLLFSLSITALIPIVPLFVTDELEATERWVGTATLFVAFAAVSTRIPSGGLSDRYGRRTLMLAGAGFAISSSILYLLATDLPTFLVGRASTGIAIGLYTTAGKALAADLAPPARRGEAMGMTNAAFSLATVVSPVLGVGLYERLGFHAVFAASLLLSTLTLAITFTLPHLRPDTTARLTNTGELRTVLRTRGLWAAVVMMLGLGVILALMFTYFPLLAERKALFAGTGGTLGDLAPGLGLSLWALTDTLVEPVAGGISDRIGRLIVALPGITLATGGLVLLSSATDLVSTYLAIIIMTTGWGMARAVAESVMQDAIAPALRGLGAAILYTSFDLAVGADAQLLGLLIDGSDFSRFFVLAVGMLASFGLAGSLLATGLQPYEQRHPRAASEPALAD